MSIGNKSFSNLSKIGFLCSDQCPSDRILKIYDWVGEITKHTALVSGFQSRIEQDVMHLALKQNIPLIKVLARGMKAKWEPEITSLLENNQILIISPFDKAVTRPSKSTAHQRNQYVVNLCEKTMIGYARSGGMLHRFWGHDKVQIIR